MISNKKGLSTVVTTLIIILLVLVAIGIIWVVIRGVIDTGSGQIDTGVACPLIDVKVINVSSICDSGSCDVTVYRSSGGEDFSGLKIVFSNATDSNSVDYPNNVAQLQTVTIPSQGVEGTTKIVIAPYFKDSQGNNQLCSSVATYNI